MATPRPFQINPMLAAIAIGYRNAEMIADLVAPRVSVPTEQYKYLEVGMEHFDPTEDLVGRKGRVRQVRTTAELKDGSVVDRGLEDVVPLSDLMAAANGVGPYDPLAAATSKLIARIVLNREIRVAGIVFNAATYLATHKVQLSGTSQWSDYTNSTPADDIEKGLETPIVRPNVMTLGQATWSKLKHHPQIARRLGGSWQEGRTVTRQEVASLFELDEVIVGMGWQNTAKPGQARTLARLWGKHCSLTRREPNLQDMETATFIATAQWGDRVAADWETRKAGLRGGRVVRAGESVGEKVLAPPLGYFIEDAVA